MTTRRLTSLSLALALTSVSAGAAAQTPPDNVKDHSKVVNSFGVGWYGVSDVPIGDVANGRSNVEAPVLGVRYWLNDLLGIDAGLGFITSSGSQKAATGGSLSTGSQTAFLLHGGVPLALSTGKHFIFEVVPEANVGFSTGSSKETTNVGSVDLSGFKIEVGARAGAEIQFGFMGLPELALEASVGLFLRDESYKAGKSSGSDFLVQTSSFSQPWDIFRSTVAARYYF